MPRLTARVEMTGLLRGVVDPVLCLTRPAKGTMRARQVEALWDLGAHKEYQGLNLRMSCRELGFAGHVTIKSRRYSTTYAALRKARADFRRGPVPEEIEDVIRESRWAFVSQGYSDDLKRFAAQVVDSIEDQRELRRDALNDLKWEQARNKGYEP